VLTGGAGGRAMSCAFEELFSIPEAFRAVQMAGCTDAWILADAAAAHGIPLDSPTLARFPTVYVKHLERELHQPGPRKGLMPGVRELLDALSPLESGYLALLTGNYEAGAKLKLEHFGLWHYFACGAFGDDAPDRNGLLPRAVARAAACGGPLVAPADAIVIGDTPLDIACAQSGGARSIGVATGNHTVDQLREAGADVVFEDLSDTAAVITALGL
jgi:phosphoglycolate phosphatase